MEKKEDQFSVIIEKPVFGGEFLARLPNGKPTFIPFVLPDEKVQIKLTQEKKGFARAKPINIIEKNSKRISPPCKYFAICGGCHYQHMSYADQLALKNQVIIEQVSRIPGLDLSRVKNILPSEKDFHYRNNVQFSVSKTGKLGFQSFGSKEIIPVDDCLLVNEQIKDIWEILDLGQFSGLRRIQIRSGIEDEGVLIIESDDFQEMPTLEVDVPVSVIHSSEVGNIVMAGDDHFICQIKDQFFHVSVDSFFQVNQIQAEKMVDLVSNYIPKSQKSLLELYSGVGLFTRFLADRFEEVYAIEESPSACDDFVINLDMFDHISLYVGSVREILPQLDIYPDVILVDPPRAGIDNKTMQRILEIQAKDIVYVSCDISTLSRDLKILLANGYEIVEMSPLDMFPQTYHIESVVCLRKSD